MTTETKLRTNNIIAGADLCYGTRDVNDGF
jgi:hypothetical protein